MSDDPLDLVREKMKELCQLTFEMGLPFQASVHTTTVTGEPDTLLHATQGIANHISLGGATFMQELCRLDSESLVYVLLDKAIETTGMYDRLKGNPNEPLPTRGEDDILH
jgi:hypothetical protein